MTRQMNAKDKLDRRASRLKAALMMAVSGKGGWRRLTGALPASGFQRW